MKNTHGGKRKTSGRKPVADKKVQVSFYIESSKIEKRFATTISSGKFQNYFRIITNYPNTKQLLTKA